MTSIYEKNYEALKEIADDFDKETYLIGTPKADDYKIRLEIIKVGVFNQMAQNLGLIWEALHSISNQMPTDTRGRD